jgi:arginine/lysine/ornithine decarboxylase
MGVINMRSTPDDECDLHDLANRILKELRSHSPLCDRYERTLAIVQDFATRCEVSNSTVEIITNIKAKCQNLLKNRVEEVSSLPPEELFQLARRLKDRYLRCQVSPRPEGGSVGHHKFAEEDPGAAKPLDMPRIQPSGTIPVTVLLVDDNVDDLERLVQLFRAWQADHAPQSPFYFEVLTFPPLSIGINEREAHFRDSEILEDLFRLLLKDQVGQLDGHFVTGCAPVYGAKYKDALRSLQAIVFDYELVCGTDKQKTPTNGARLAVEARRFRPTVGRYLLTGKLEAFKDKAGRAELFHSMCFKDDLDIGEGEELFLAILRDLRRKYKTPFWDALHTFAERPVITCHAMALAQGRSARKGATIVDFVDFYKLNYFRAEASATTEPLDSLLHPTGSIRDAQLAAARAFGAWRSLFVTNGTSTSNKIVLQTLLKPGDAVLVDRNCHISHHYAIALARARPYYMEPYELPEYKIGGGITLDTIDASLRQVWQQSKGIPKAVLITNCTFDGLICDPKEVIKRVRETLRAISGTGGEDRLKDIVFIFDEAWFAFARFHPLFVRRTVMAAAAELEAEEPMYYEGKLRVYATQSTHKTLSAFRQGSMIHIRDPLLERADLYPSASIMLKTRLEHAFLTHTSTSPHNGIIASLDVARRQADLEGTVLVGQAIDLANQLRANLSTGGVDTAWNTFHRYFQVVKEDDLIPRDLMSQFMLDPTKITLMLKGDITTGEMKRVLLDNYDIQFNKYSDNTVLLMVTIGASRSTVENITNALLRYAQGLQDLGVPLRAEFRPDAVTEDEKIERRKNKTFWIPKFSGFAERPVAVATERPNDLGRFFFNDDNYIVERRRLKECVGKQYPSAAFVVPYPPGYPVLVPGQVISDEMVDFLGEVATTEIHGTDKDRNGLLLLVYGMVGGSSDA